MDTEKPTNTKEFPDAFALVKPSWKAFQVNFETFVWQIFLPTAIAGLVVLSFVFAGFVYAAIDEVNILPFILPTLLMVAGVVVGVAVVSSIVVTELHSSRGQHVGFRQALREVHGHIWRLVGLFILTSIIVGIGMILFIVPGLFFMQRLLIAPYYLVDQKLGVFESMRRSWRDGKHEKFSGALWGVVGVIMLINIISWIPFVGWLISLVMTIVYLCAPAIRYTQIMAHKKNSSTVEA